MPRILGFTRKRVKESPTAVSGCGGPTEKISRLIDYHIKPKIESYSGHLIELLERTTLPSICTIGTIDVKSMYTNISHEEGINARLYTNNPYSNKIHIPFGAMSDLLKIVLKNNYFQFADQMYHQKQGTAMGTVVAPSYAKADLEEIHLAGYPTPPILWKRYIDDILVIWPGDQINL